MRLKVKLFWWGLFILSFSLQGFFFVSAQINTLPNGGFEEAELPAYWTKVEAGDAVVVWATDQYRSPQRSLKISDTGGADAPAWVSENMAKLNWNPTTGIPANIEIEVGGWGKTENVNTNPTTEDQKIQLIYSFYDAQGNKIFGQDVVLNVPQSQASTNWTEIKNDVSLVLPVDADSLIITFKFGANATGTVWLDDIFMRPAPGASGWIGDLYNANFGVPKGWFFWKGQMSEGVAGKGVVTITSDYSHSGNYSLLVEDDATNPDEVVAISDRNPIEPGRSYGISAWVKTVGVNTNPTKDVEKSIFFTLTYHTDAAGWAEITGEDFFIVDQTITDRDWTLYTFTFTPPTNATRVSVRPRFQHQATGKVYWDDFRMYPVELAKTNFTFDEVDRPAYWYRENFSDATVEWATDQYRSAERSLKISDAGGSDEPLWKSTNMAKLNWNPVTGIPANIEIEVGGWVKTENVNTNPTTEDQKIQLIYSFYDAQGNKIFGQDVVLNVP
ncbi:MAG: carbohydrate binding domain-containing protein, partial [candidate division KSB1 bacterium]|nr:carbohydrate binding domain-containing protein [candidate division KSB1 bacterium]